MDNLRASEIDRELNNQLIDSSDDESYIGAEDVPSDFEQHLTETSLLLRCVLYIHDWMPLVDRTGPVKIQTTHICDGGDTKRRNGLAVRTCLNLQVEYCAANSFTV
ncbi:hypothetical protein J6590_069044 [Homalodisca vitripennis]|nr:hypothetical protein J6590_069044 [Homalodisca vitripennis]